MSMFASRRQQEYLKRKKLEEKKKNGIPGQLSKKETKGGSAVDQKTKVKKEESPQASE